MKKQILLCVAGMTPQIITETLWALVENGERVDEIRVITTLKGKRRLIETLFGKNGKLDEFCRDFGIEPGSIKFDESTITPIQKPDGESLEDIRTAEDNEIAGNEICRIVRELCRRENTRIHASAAGGRKTMSVYLAAAMSLFGRADDCLSHVLVSEDFETGNAPDFFYKPKTPKSIKFRDGHTASTAAAEIYLAEIPFVRLRGVRLNLFEEPKRTYKNAVEEVQSDLRLLESANNLYFNLRMRTVTIASRSAKLRPREFFVFAMFADFRLRSFGENGFVGLSKINREILDEFCRKYSKSVTGREYNFDDFETLPHGAFVRNLETAGVRHDRQLASIAEARDKVNQTFHEIFSKIKNACQKSGIPPEFCVQSVGESGNQKHGINLLPERIKFIL